MSKTRKLKREKTWKPEVEAAAPRLDLAEGVVAAVLAGVVMLRPWIDGITFADKNFYFIWALTAGALVWAGASLLRSSPRRGGGIVFILAGFLAVGLFTSFDSVRYDRSHTDLAIWAGHFVAFGLAAAALRSRAAVTLVLGSFILTSFAEALYAVVHLHYWLPMTRQRVLSDPNTLAQFFGTTELTPVLAHRLNVNRAFGSLLFPNALAAWLIMGIPLGLCTAVSAGVRLKQALKKASAGEDGGGKDGGGEDRVWHSAVAAVFGTLIPFAAITTFYSLYFMFAHPGEHWLDYPVRWGLYCLLIPLASGTVALLAVRAYGLRAYLLGVTILGCVCLCVAESYALWLSASRGGMLAVTGATVATLALVVYSRRRNKEGPSNGQTTRIVAATVLVTVAVAVAGAGGAPADRQSGPPAGGAGPQGKIVVEGVDVTMEDLTNPATMFLRLSYWKSGLRMAYANLWTGVGLGNFSTMYPRYQYLGAGDVRQAHNDFLQVLCETGVAGFVLFSLFWGCVFFWGSRRVLSETNAAERWLLAGVTGGTLAFVMHAVVDFNFFNPSLACAAFIMAGLIFALGRRPASTAPVRARLPWLVAGVAVAAAAASYPVYWLNREIGLDFDRMSRIQSMRHLLTTLKTTSQDEGKPRFVRAGHLLPLVDEEAGLRRIGTLHVLQRNRSLRDFEAGDALDLNTIVIIRDTAAARLEAVRIAKAWREKTREADAVFPYVPEVAVDLFQWNDLIARTTQDAVEKQNAMDASLNWVEEAVERSPMQAAFRELHANVLWGMAKTEHGPEQIAMLEAALDEAAMAARLYPTRPKLWRQLGTRQAAFGEELERLGDERGPELIEQGRQNIERARAIVKRRQQLAGKGP